MGADLAGKVAIVTGGANGTGLACVATLAQAGAQMALADLDRQAAEKRAAELTAATGQKILAVEADVSDPEQCRRMVQQSYEAFGRVDILVNCAGIFTRQPALEMDVTGWKRIFEVNLHGAYYCSLAFARQVIEQKAGGAIVNISSTASTNNFPGQAAYSASKAALNNLTQALAVEWAQYGLRVNAVAPCHVNTERIRRVASQGQLDIPAMSRRIPMGRLAEPEEVADAVLFLCSDQARFITGQLLYVDGGFNVSRSW
jgi:NAD(P)-dependent dehydrogenase (short-subunit alcohol dehydrogenase family)